MSRTEQPIEFDLIFKDLEVQQDEIPNIKIHHTVATTIKRDDLFVKINGIEYIAEINEILKSNGNENQLIDLGSTYSHHVSFFSTNNSTDRSVVLRFPLNEFSKIVDSKLINGKFTFTVNCAISYDIYFYQNGYYYLKDVVKSPFTFMHSAERQYRVEPSDQQISLIIKNNKYTNRLIADLPLLDEPINNQSLSSAIENLKLAGQGLIEGNFNAVILNTRNALSNNLTEKDNSSTKKKNVLKKDIKEACLSKIPSKDKKDYKEILNQIGSILASLLSINHKYAHENQTTITMRPLHADLELLFFSASMVTKYLTTLNNGKF